MLTYIILASLTSFLTSMTQDSVSVDIHNTGISYLISDFYNPDSVSVDIHNTGISYLISDFYDSGFCEC